VDLCALTRPARGHPNRPGRALSLAPLPLPAPPDRPSTTPATHEQPWYLLASFSTTCTFKNIFCTDAEHIDINYIDVNIISKQFSSHQSALSQAALAECRGVNAECFANSKESRMSTIANASLSGTSRVASTES